MYDDRRYGRYVRANRWKAIFFTILFHFAVLGALGFFGDHDFKQYIPEIVKEAIGMEADEADKDAIRP